MGEKSIYFSYYTRARVILNTEVWLNFFKVYHFIEQLLGIYTKNVTVNQKAHDGSTSDYYAITW